MHRQRASEQDVAGIFRCVVMASWERKMLNWNLSSSAPSIPCAEAHMRAVSGKAAGWCVAGPYRRTQQHNACLRAYLFFFSHDQRSALVTWVARNRIIAVACPAFLKALFGYLRSVPAPEPIHARIQGIQLDPLIPGSCLEDPFQHLDRLDQFCSAGPGTACMIC